MGEFQAFISIGAFEIIATFANTIITFLIVRNLLYQPVKNIIAQREKEIDAIYTEAERSKKDAENMKLDYTKRMALAKEEAAELVKKSTKTATQKAEEILADANKQAGHMLKKAEVSIEQEKKRTIKEIQSEISEMAVMIASKVIEKDINEKDHKSLIDEFISNVGEA